MSTETILKRVWRWVVNKTGAIAIPNKAERIEVDLSVERNEPESLGVDGFHFTVINKGTGTYTLYFVMEDNSELMLKSDEIATGTRLMLRFKNIKIQNAAQNVVNPVFYIAKYQY